MEWTEVTNIRKMSIILASSLIKKKDISILQVIMTIVLWIEGLNHGGDRKENSKLEAIYLELWERRIIITILVLEIIVVIELNMLIQLFIPDTKVQGRWMQQLGPGQPLIMFPTIPNTLTITQEISIPMPRDLTIMVLQMPSSNNMYNKHHKCD